MKTLDRKLLRELYSSKGLLLAITSIVAVGMTCFVSMLSAYHNLQQAKVRYYRQCRMADFWIELKKAPSVELEQLTQMPGVMQVTPRIQFAATVDLEDVVKPVNSLLLSLPDQRQQVINDVVLKQGDYFTNERQNEVIVNASFAREHNLFPGSWIHILLDNRRQELFVVGTAISSEFTYLLGPGAVVPDPKNFGVFYLKQSYAEDVFSFDGAANQVAGRWAPGAQDQSERLLAAMEERLEPYGVFSVTGLDRQVSNQFLTSEIQGLGATAAVIPTIFLLVAALVLNVLITRLARQQRTVIGTIKALGYTDWQVFNYFLKFGLSVGIMGGVLGSVLGYAAATGMTVMYRQFFEFPELLSGFYWYTHLVGLAVCVSCAVAGSLYGARSVLRLEPAAAMRPAPPRSGRKIWLERFDWLWQQLTAPWRLAVRGVFRHRLRTLAGVFAAAMGASLLVAGFMMTEIQHYLIEFQFHEIMRSDIDLAFDDERGRDAWSEVQHLPGVDWAEPTLNVAVRMVHGPYRRKSGITGLIPEARLTVPYDEEGDPIRLPEAGLVLTQRLAEILHAEPGDRITLIPIKGERHPVQATVAHVSESYLGLAAYADIRYLSRLLNSEFLMTGAQLKVNGDPRDRLALYRELKQIPAIQSVVSRHDIIENLVKTLLNNQFIFIGLLILFAGIVFFGSIVNASMVSLAERQREVATFRALGYGPWTIGGMFLRENLIVNAVGTLCGLPVGYLLVELTALAYAQNDLIRLPVVSAPWVWLYTIGLAFLFAMMAHGVVQRRIHLLNYLEALKVKE